jgi:hypothetical protein
MTRIGNSAIWEITLLPRLDRQTSTYGALTNIKHALFFYDNLLLLLLQILNKPVVILTSPHH